jgi:hypothetical protein
MLRVDVIWSGSEAMPHLAWLSQPIKLKAPLLAKKREEWGLLNHYVVLCS